VRLQWLAECGLECRTPWVCLCALLLAAFPQAWVHNQLAGQTRNKILRFSCLQAVIASIVAVGWQMPRVGYCRLGLRLGHSLVQMKLQLFSVFLSLPLLLVGAALHGGAHGARLALVGTLAMHVCIMGFARRK